MKNDKLMKKLLSLASAGLLVMAAGAGISAQSLPAAVAEAAQTGTITLDNAVPDSKLSLYQVRTYNGDGTYSTTEGFADIAVDYDVKEASDMRALCNTLASYTEGEEAPNADVIKTAAADGSLEFTDLEPGLYLITGETVHANYQTTVQAPVLTYVPAEDADGNVTYDIDVTMKQESTTDVTSYSVYKVWKDDESKDRPTEIQVQLRCDGKALGDAVTLNSANNWKYTWDELEAGHKYTVTEEKVPSGYTVTITEENAVFTIRNTKTPTTPPKTPPTTPSNPPKTPGSKLPQTGQLWWPVPILAVLGLLFFAAGIIKKRNFSEEK